MILAPGKGAGFFCSLGVREMGLDAHDPRSNLKVQGNHLESWFVEKSTGTCRW